MSFAKQLGQHLQKRAMLDQLGEGIVKLLNKATPKSKLGLGLATKGVGPRLESMAAKYGPQTAGKGKGAANSFSSRVLNRIAKSPGGVDPGIEQLVDQRVAKLNSIREKARQARMTAIGAGSLGAAGGLAATQLAGGQRETPAQML